ncbi:MAG: 50S ribosomal protein L25 [Chitinophagaceae bacterium]|nr:50S ribosomal protein L25 [Chitinophagaceae bacterium]MCB9045959.1 50S ribosomal protein L25 [Chitinophagales bacterium]
MKTIKVEGQIRSDFGKGATRRLRSEGQVPVVIYGGDEIIHCSVAPLAVRGLVYTPEFQVVEVNLEGKAYRCILKDLQFDVVTDALTHIDLLELVDGKKVIANLPLNFVGQPKGVKEGGRLVIKLKNVKVRTYPRFLKEHLEVNIEELELNGNVRVEDIPSENIEIMNSPRIPIASVVMTRALRQAGADAAAEEKAGKK